jgi:hypothetical protein
VVCLMSGGAAELIFLGDVSPDGSGSDHSKVWQRLTALGLGNADSDILWAQACALVREHRAAITRVAVALHTRGTLDGDSIDHARCLALGR